MYKEIYKQIKKYDTIVLARHIGVDPDALASQTSLRDAIKLTFPEKKVLALGSGSSKFNYLSPLDKMEEIDYEKSLLIVLDTPDKKRVDIENFDLFKYKIKIDHHPFIEKMCDLELIDDKASSACQLVIELLYETKLKRNETIMKNLYIGMVTDTNRFLFTNTTSRTFLLASQVMEEYNFDLNNLYLPIYLRPLNELRLEGYISLNMQITENGVGHIKITDDILKKFKADASSAGNMVNNFNFVDEILVWLTVSEDIKNNIFKVSIRSRGPVINKVAEKYGGGGHKLASGVRFTTLEEVDFLINDLDKVCKEYLEGGEENENNEC